MILTTWMVGLLCMRLADPPDGRWWVYAGIISVTASLAVSAVLAFPLASVMLNTPRLGGARRITEATAVSLLIGVPLAVQTGAVAGSGTSAVGFGVLALASWLGLAVTVAQVPLPVTDNEPMMRSDLRRPVYPRRRRLRGFKRIVDLAVSSVAIIAALPIFVVTALAIWLHDRGPVLFKQERVGRHGATFRIYKFRSMVTEAEFLKQHLAESNERNGPLFKLSNDPRVTPIGRIIRQLSIDELPQLFNVLRGDMSLVGPRPALAEELEEFHRVHRETRLLVKPGITGLWQAEARSDPDFGRVEQLDIRYVREWSASLDLWILVATVIEMVRTVLALPLRRLGIRLASGEQIVVSPASVDGQVPVGDVIDVVIPFPDTALTDVSTAAIGPVRSHQPAERTQRQEKASDHSAKVS